MAHATTRPVRLRVHDTTLACQVARTIGYAARCACGWEGPIRRRYDEARTDSREHNANACVTGVDNLPARV